MFDSFLVVASTKRPERREVIGPLVEAIEAGRARGPFRADHLLHLWCEIPDPATPALVDATIGRGITWLVSVMDHTPGDRQSPDTEKWFAHMLRELAIDEAAGRAHVAAAIRDHGIPLMSQDDRSRAHVDQAVAEAVAVAEFPTTLDAARHVRARGLGVVAGAPDRLRDGPQSRNVVVGELLAAGLFDALASDHVPRSPLDAALALADNPAVALVTAVPARLAGPADGGRIAPGLRADLVAVRRVDGQPHVTAVWREGRRVI